MASSLNCPSCGAPVRRSFGKDALCEYCGSFIPAPASEVSVAAKTIVFSSQPSVQRRPVYVQRRPMPKPSAKTEIQIEYVRPPKRKGKKIFGIPAFLLIALGIFWIYAAGQYGTGVLLAFSLICFYYAAHFFSLMSDEE